MARWIVRMVVDVVRFGIVNRSYAMSFAVLAFLTISFAIIAAQASAPFIYTLF
jgi:hypothetical protein